MVPYEQHCAKSVSFGSDWGYSVLRASLFRTLCFPMEQVSLQVVVNGTDSISLEVETLCFTPAGNFSTLLFSILTSEVRLLPDGRSYDLLTHTYVGVQ